MKAMAVETIACKGDGDAGTVSLDTITYVKARPDQTYLMRQEFNEMKFDFVRQCVLSGVLDGALSEQEAEQALKEGLLPSRLSLHHMVPLGGCGKNNVSMFKILPRDFHSLIHYVYDKMVCRIKVGDAIELPTMGMKPEKVYYPEVTPEAFVACKLYAPEAVYLLDDQKFDFPPTSFYLSKHERKAVHDALRFIHGPGECSFISFEENADFSVARSLMAFRFLEHVHA
ncbi:MAG: hypothetical protein IKD08_01425 [Alphaproteobacteria bacterium]|nr:hypothetical protein [Alphaproteobacteria bacterium]